MAITENRSDKTGRKREQAGRYSFRIGRRRFPVGSSLMRTGRSSIPVGRSSIRGGSSFTRVGRRRFRIGSSSIHVGRSLILGGSSFTRVGRRRFQVGRRRIRIGRYSKKEIKKNAQNSSSFGRLIYHFPGINRTGPSRPEGIGAQCPYLVFWYLMSTMLISSNLRHSTPRRS